MLNTQYLIELIHNRNRIATPMPSHKLSLDKTISSDRSIPFADAYLLLSDHSSNPLLRMEGCPRQETMSRSVVSGHQGHVFLRCPCRRPQGSCVYLVSVSRVCEWITHICVWVWASLDYRHIVLLTVISLWVVHVKTNPSRRNSQRASLLQSSHRWRSVTRSRLPPATPQYRAAAFSVQHSPHYDSTAEDGRRRRRRRS